MFLDSRTTDPDAAAHVADHLSAAGRLDDWCGLVLDEDSPAGIADGFRREQVQARRLDLAARAAAEKGTAAAAVRVAAGAATPRRGPRPSPGWWNPGSTWLPATPTSTCSARTRSAKTAASGSRRPSCGSPPPCHATRSGMPPPVRNSIAPTRGCAGGRPAGTARPGTGDLGPDDVAALPRHVTGSTALPLPSLSSAAGARPSSRSTATAALAVRVAATSPRMRRGTRCALPCPAGCPGAGPRLFASGATLPTRPGSTRSSGRCGRAAGPAAAMAGRDAQRCHPLRRPAGGRCRSRGTGHASFQPASGRSPGQHGRHGNPSLPCRCSCPRRSRPAAEALVPAQLRPRKTEQG